MHLHTPPLSLPPERRPYLRVSLLGGVADVVLRVPTLAGLVKELSDEQRRKLFGIASTIAAGHNPVALIIAADDVLPLLTGLLGVMWADPHWAIDTMRADGEDFATYGERVLEELHEAGVQLQHLILVAMDVAEDLRQSSGIDGEVARRLAFFQRTQATPSDSASPSNATSSTPTPDDASVS